MEIGSAEIVVRGFGNLLEASADIVGEKSYRAAKKSGQIRPLGSAKALDRGAQLLERVGDRAHFDSAPRPDDIHPVFSRAHHHRWLRSEKRIASPLFAAAHAFEEEGVVAALDFQERRDRSLQVGGDFLEDGDQVKSLRRQLFEFTFTRLQHVASSLHLSLRPSRFLSPFPSPQPARFHSLKRKRKGPRGLRPRPLRNRFCDELQSRRAGGYIAIPAPPSRANFSAHQFHREVSNPYER